MTKLRTVSCAMLSAPQPESRELVDIRLTVEKRDTELKGEGGSFWFESRGEKSWVESREERH